ncbi:DUF2218 domain-containing protein [Marinobacter sp.]|uniref:DUF2218 domain-containing protein n=1 Tax=Marinobacter sp. TaxID=50741 RepID=UPI0035C751E1
MLTKIADVTTVHAGRYLVRLCKHFSHKVPAEWQDKQGQITFSMGVCRLQASNQSLRLRCESDSQDNLGRLGEVIASHLVRFAEGARDREVLQVVWEAGQNG